MAQAYSKAARRKAKKALAKFALAETPRRKKRGKARMQELDGERDPQAAVLSVRARMMGLPDTAKARDEMKNQALGEPAGRAICIRHEGAAAARLWGVYRGLTGAEECYARRVLGKGLHPKTAKVEMVPERVEADPDESPDLRDEEERHRDATNVWMRWRGYVGHLSVHDQAAIFCVVRGRKEPIADAELTPAGEHFVSALEKLADVVDRRR